MADLPAGVPEIEMDELRSALERHGSLKILDVRPARDRAEWWIPGSEHVDAYDDLWKGETGVLQQAVRTWPRDVRVVAVCARGRTSLLAADALRKMGFDAFSLTGGMRGWSEAWSLAEVALPAGAPAVLQVRRIGKGCLSYLVAADGQAAAIDPCVPAAVYQRLAAERGWRIAAVFDTHVHADHVSRAHALARATGAPLYLPVQGRVLLPFTPVGDGQEIAIGRACVRAVRTPGHTHESTCYEIVPGDGGPRVPVALVTGDTLFLESVGRPDLKAAGGETAVRARLLYRSLRERVFAHTDEVIVLPGHISRPLSFDGVAHAAPLGEVRARVAPLVGLDEEGFVAAVLARIPETPPNYAQVVAINDGREPEPEDLSTLEAGANRCAISV